MTRFQLHVSNWINCTRCHLHEQRKHVVLARGSVPCEILFVGEAPGFTEDVYAQPFVGKAGELQDDIVKRAVPPELSVCFTNLVGCIPKLPDGSKAEAPEHECIMACRPRLEKFIEICNPKLIVCLGKEADSYFDTSYKDCVKFDPRIRVVSTIHPAGILRKPPAAHGLLIQKCVIQIVQAIKKLNEPVQ